MSVLGFIDILWEVLSFVWDVVSFMWSILPDEFTDVLTYVFLGTAIVIAIFILALAFEFFFEPATESPPRPTAEPPPRPTVPSGPTGRQSEWCPICQKDIFATEDDAWDAVRRSQRRFEQGQPGRFEEPLDHAYYEAQCHNWHVSSQPHY